MGLWGAILYKKNNHPYYGALLALRLQSVPGACWPALIADHVSQLFDYL